MARQIGRHHLELAREAAYLISPGIGAAAGAVHQDKSLAPKGPPPARVGKANGQVIDPNACPLKRRRRQGRHEKGKLPQEARREEGVTSYFTANASVFETYQKNRNNLVEPLGTNGLKPFSARP